MVLLERRGLVYGVNSDFQQTKQTTDWWFASQVSQKNIHALFEIIVSELEKIFEGNIDAYDIETAKAYDLGRFQRGAQTVGGTAGGYRERYFLDGVVNDYYQVPKRIRAVNKTAIVDISRALFTDKVWGLGMLGNCDEELVKQQYDQISSLWNSDKV